MLFLLISNFLQHENEMLAKICKYEYSLERYILYETYALFL